MIKEVIYIMLSHESTSNWALTFGVLSVTYVTTSCLSTACYQWHMSLYFVLSLCYWQNMLLKFYRFELCGPTKHSCRYFHTAFHYINRWERGFEWYHFQYDDQTFFGVCAKLLLKNWSFCGQFGCKYDWACI